MLSKAIEFRGIRKCAKKVRKCYVPPLKIMLKYVLVVNTNFANFIRILKISIWSHLLYSVAEEEVKSIQEKNLNEKIFSILSNIKIKF